MSVLDQIRQLDEQRAALLTQAKNEAIGQAEQAIKILNELGFHYQLVKTNVPGVRAVAAGSRRNGVRQDVLRLIEEHADGISRADLLDLMGAKGDKKGEQSISNALSNLKKDAKVDLVDGFYSIAP